MLATIVAAAALVLASMNAFASLWTVREMTLTRFSRAASGEIGTVELAFGADNDLTNRLYVAYGSSDGGNRIEGWENHDFVRDVKASESSVRLSAPRAKFVRYFLDASPDANAFLVPVKCVTGDGSAYADVGLAIEGGDDITARVRMSSGYGGIMGTRNAVNSECVNAVVNGGKITMDYNSSSYPVYRLSTSAISLGAWYELRLSADERSVSGADGAFGTTNSMVNADKFTTRNTCWLFKVSGNPAVPEVLSGSIASFSIRRGDLFVSFCEPFRLGETYGFFDRARGRFISSAVAESPFTGEEDASLASPLTTSTETLERLPPSGEATPRTVSAAMSGGRKVALSFGADNGLANRLFCAYGTRKGGDVPGTWQNVVDLGVVDGTVDVMEYEPPEGARACRFFLFLPFEGRVPPVQLAYVSGDGSGYYDTGVIGMGGDEIEIMARPKSLSEMQLFGCRSTPSADGANIMFVLTSSTRFQLDYTGSVYAPYRCTSSVIDYSDFSIWYDLTATPESRSVSIVGGDRIGSNDAANSDEFETLHDCWLFGMSGHQVVNNRFNGDVAYLKMRRGGAPLICWRPCKMGDAIGFYDTISTTFHAAAEGGFTGEEESSVSRFAAMSDIVAVAGGFVLVVR